VAQKPFSTIRQQALINLSRTGSALRVLNRDFVPYVGTSKLLVNWASTAVLWSVLFLDSIRFPVTRNTTTSLSLEEFVPVPFVLRFHLGQELNAIQAIDGCGSEKHRGCIGDRGENR
jgi:hypothetical protein